MTNKKTGIVEYDEVIAENPITHALETVRIEKVPEITPEERDERIATELKKYGLVAVEKVEIDDPSHGRKAYYNP